MSYYIREIGIPILPFAIDGLMRNFLSAYSDWWEKLDPGMIFLSFGLWAIYLLVRSSPKISIASDAEVERERGALRQLLMMFSIFGFVFLGVSLFIENFFGSTDAATQVEGVNIGKSIAIIAIVYLIGTVLLIVLQRDKIIDMSETV